MTLSGDEHMKRLANADVTQTFPQRADSDESKADGVLQQCDDDGFTLIAKWRGKAYELQNISLGTTTIGDLKQMLFEVTAVRPERQKLLGLGPKKTVWGGVGGTNETSPLSALGLKKSPHRFMLMGTPEEDIFVDPAAAAAAAGGGGLPEVFDDFALEVTAAAETWHREVSNAENLRRFTAATAVHFIHAPRPGRRLLVLDLDHTLLDFSSSAADRRGTRRPGMDAFLAAAWEDFDLCVWSQTSWRWLEVKLTELGMLVHPLYRISFVLDKTSMFSIVSTDHKGRDKKHQVKPLQIIWTKFEGQWGPHNTLHIDDLQRNFALNPKNGIKIKPYYRKERGEEDRELHRLAMYLKTLCLDPATAGDLTRRDHAGWRRGAGEGALAAAQRAHNAAAAAAAPAPAPAVEEAGAAEASAVGAGGGRAGGAGLLGLPTPSAGAAATEGQPVARRVWAECGAGGAGGLAVALGPLQDVEEKAGETSREVNDIESRSDGGVDVGGGSGSGGSSGSSDFISSATVPPSSQPLPPPPPSCDKK